MPDVVLADDLDPVLIEALAAQPTDLTPLVALRRAVERTYREMSADELLYASIDMIVGAIAQRLCRSPDDFEIKVFAGAVTGAVMGGASGPNGGIANAVEAIELLEQGLHLS